MVRHWRAVLYSYIYIYISLIIISLFMVRHWRAVFINLFIYLIIYGASLARCVYLCPPKIYLSNSFIHLA